MQKLIRKSESRPSPEVKWKLMATFDCCSEKKFPRISRTQPTDSKLVVLHSVNKLIMMDRGKED